MKPKTNTLRCYRHSGPLDLKTLKNVSGRFLRCLRFQTAPTGYRKTWRIVLKVLQDLNNGTEDEHIVVSVVSTLQRFDPTQNLFPIADIVSCQRGSRFNEERVEMLLFPFQRQRVFFPCCV